MELLAPAGNMECLKTAVQSGANAVYLAGKSFGARSFADNFTEEELREAIRYCHLRHVKAYVTVNTMTLDRELGEMDAFIAILADAGADGVIVQDMGVLRRVHEICPDLPIHASTQMTIHNLAGVKALETLGVTRVVLSRELSGKEIETIKKNCHAELEVFVHGAMCMSYSGQCLMSSVLGGRSGNRGKCAQPCRLAYRQKDGKEQFYLSLKDMSLIRHLEELQKMGVASLKIEGRMKGPDYVAAVVGTYRRCLDERRMPKKEEELRLNQVFYRGGLTDGYYTNQKGTGMFAFDKPDNPYLKGADAMQATPLPERTEPIFCKVVLGEGKVPEITLKGMGHEILHCGEFPLQTAQKNPANQESVREQISKTGGTAFRFEPLEIEIIGAPFAPVKELNALRRSAIEKLEHAILSKDKKTIRNKPLCLTSAEQKPMQITAGVRTKEQFEAVCDLNLSYIDVPLSVVYEHQEYFVAYKERVVVAPPVIVTDTDYESVCGQIKELNQMGFSLLRAENIYWLIHKNWNLLGGHRLNVANSLAMQQLGEMGLKTICLSAELNLAQVRDIRKCFDTELLIYGHLPLMITENCVLKNMKACPCDGIGEIVDRKGAVFPVIKDDTICRSVILNSVPLYLADKLDEVQDCGVAYGRMQFTIETPKDCRMIAEQYLKLQPAIPLGAYTRLHFYKGVL